jgi:hypothetical protein
MWNDGGDFSFIVLTLQVGSVVKDYIILDQRDKLVKLILGSFLFVAASLSAAAARGMIRGSHFGISRLSMYISLEFRPRASCRNRAPGSYT